MAESPSTSPMYDHRIRLAGPWRIGSDSLRIPGPFPGTESLHLRRHFRWVAAKETIGGIDLILEGCTRRLRAVLNGKELGTIAPGAIGVFPVLDALEIGNELLLEAGELDGDARCEDGLWSPPTLAIWGSTDF